MHECMCMYSTFTHTHGRKKRANAQTTRNSNSGCKNAYAFFLVSPAFPEQSLRSNNCPTCSGRAGPEIPCNFLLVLGTSWITNYTGPPPHALISVSQKEVKERDNLETDGKGFQNPFLCVAMASVASLISPL